MVADSMLITLASTSVMLRLESMTEVPSPSVKARMSDAFEMTGESLAPVR